MKSIALTLLFSVAIHFAAAADAAFDCIIASDRTTYSVGEIPKITFRITNKTTKEVVLVGSLDGSTMGRRFPKCSLEILDAAGKAVTLPLGACGNMNPLQTNDFVIVPAGGTFDPFGTGFFPPHQLVQFPVTVPGAYTLRFSYTTSDRLKDYSGNNHLTLTAKTEAKPEATLEIKSLFERVPKLDLKSNELKLTFTAKPQ